jgi:hypothetical protein
VFVLAAVVVVVVVVMIIGIFLQTPMQALKTD